MALKAGMVGLSAGSSVLTGGPGDALRGRSRSRSLAAVDGLCFADPTPGGFAAARSGGYLFNHRSTANSELARTRGIRLFN